VSERRSAAVVLAIISRSPNGVIFVERAAHLRSHPGQIGLPGGTADRSDGGDLQRTALREMEEEVGVTPDRVEFVWTLPRVWPRVTPFDVMPYVAIVAPGPLRIDPSETAAVFTVPLSVLVDELREGTIEYGAVTIETTLLDYDGRRIWGLTGRVLRTFVDAWNAPGSDMRAIIEQRLQAPRRDG
jgi:8-oxo-dGTP pyrophosphatase MutT (NUDIX family)